MGYQIDFSLFQLVSFCVFLCCHCLQCVFVRSGETVLLVDVVADGNTPPQIGASRYDVYVSEGVPINSQIFTIPVSTNASVFCAFFKF